MTLQIQFGKRVREIRNSHGLSQEALAYKAGIDRTYMTDIENGKRNVSIQNIEKIINALELPIEDFFKSPIFLNH
ncbi:MAG: helix-turn-helix transcriptional regulator [Prolixibacteraceae bacterium]|jgi:transcriptional regulator with XRE-family HTH domain|nr:helix-turn-helix transcriptional regulator [Prolixibacteraceae bacterium]